MVFSGILYSNFILGTLGNDSILGTNGLDSILGLAGQDTLNGRENNDLLIGGNGDDSLIGEAGFDFLLGGHGDDSLDGGDDDDNLHGGNGFDLLLGFAGHDILNGGNDDDILDGGDGNDFLDGGDGNDSLNGGDGDDTLKSGVSTKNPNFLETNLEVINLASTNVHQVHSQFHQVFSSIDFLLALHHERSPLSNSERLNADFGSDTLDGGAGYDTVDYTDFGQAVTLTPSGIVEKANGHSDLLINVEKIVGAVGQANKIDALSASGDSVYLDADLSANRLTVKGIAGLGDLNFEVENFLNLSGTNQSDKMIGNDDNNILEGYDGSDTLDGGAGYDTVDYTDFGQAVTLTPSGIVEKANGHSDLLINVEKIVGAVGQDNKIDALSASGDSVYLDADLSANRLTVKGIAGLGDLNFEVENFRHISGTNQSDRMIGNDDNNILEGYDGSDTLDGGAGYDTVDYTDFGQAVTLTPSGIVEKANGHSDLLINVEKIVGAVGQDNKLDALSASGDSVYLDADLSTNRLTVKGISGLGDLNFEVLHFRNLSGTNQSDIMSGNDDNNILEGHDGNDIMYAGLGNDTLDGGGYFDTVDYRNYGQAITITPTGVVEKANGQNDLLINVEKIVGAVAQENKIDAISVFGDAVYLDADLSANRLTVKGIAELGDLNFEVVNFRHLSGTNQSDKMIGNDSNNIFEGYDGSDTLDGGAGYDTVDYTEFGQAVTVTPTGIVKKANGHSDLLINVEKIVGATGQSNKIDASSAPADTVNLYVDLSLEQLLVKDIPVIGEQDFQVVNFLNVSGTNQADTIIGDSHSNILEGNGGNDILSGSSQNYYAAEIDIVTGGDGADKFVLGDYTEAFYQGDGFARITDFDSSEGDRLVAFGTAEDYTISQFEGGANISYQGDVVAFVVNTNDVDLYSDFEFV